jgi:hypothetical protein
MSWDDFVVAYRKIVSLSVERLRANRFACFVVGDIRAPGGGYRGLVTQTINAFIAAGTVIWNDAILLTKVGSLPVRAARPFQESRKLGKTHQNVLVFVKGSAAEAVKAIGEAEHGWPDVAETTV